MSSWSREAIEGRGRGLVANTPFREGEVVLVERPVVELRNGSDLWMGMGDGEPAKGFLDGLDLLGDVSEQPRKFPYMAEGLMAQTLLGDHKALWARLGQLCFATIPITNPQLTADYFELLDKFAGCAGGELAHLLARGKEAVPPCCLKEVLQAEVPIEVYARIVGILHLNTFSLDHSDARKSESSALFHHASFINHSCDPNVAMDAVDADGNVRLSCRRAVLPGEELTIAYIDCGLPTDLRKEKLEWAYAFTCVCSRCRAPT
jgi:hypothetical protein